MAATVRISETSRNLLADLAQEADTSMTAVLDAALEAYRRQRFLAQAAAAYEAIAIDPDTAADYHREMSDLDGTASDGLEPYLA
jgi:hypothetical protein